MSVLYNTSADPLIRIPVTAKAESISNEESHFMKNFTVGVLLLLLFSATIFAQETNFKIESLGWMSGCWQSKDGSISEFWTSVAGGSMLGAGRTIKNGKLVDYEYLRIVQDEKGIFYIARPKANAEETPFKLNKLTANEAVFENAAHDFPQRIIYRLDNGKDLFARIEGNNKGKFMGFDFPMSRIKCDQ